MSYALITDMSISYCERNSMVNVLPEFESIENLHNWLKAQGDPELLRRVLWQSFQEVVEYQDSNEWSKAVTICEALAIVGWGHRERVTL
jgi:hypothetical protein